MNTATSTIMLVDERPAGMEALSACLDAAEHTLVTVADGLAAWEMLLADPCRFDLVILDQATPGLDGVRLFKKMQGHPVLHGVPAILQTDSTGRARVHDEGLSAVLSCVVKPYEQAELARCLATALQSRVCYRSSLEGPEYRGDALGSAREATFTFKTIHSARALAALLANTCPEPQRVVVGLAELLLNAVEHGNLRISYDEKTRLRRENRWEEEVAARLADPANADKEVWVEYAREPDRIRVLIRDQGDGFDWRSYLAMDPANAIGLHGRGIAIARMMSFDSIAYRGKGNEVEVTVDTLPR